MDRKREAANNYLREVAKSDTYVLWCKAVDAIMLAVKEADDSWAEVVRKAREERDSNFAKEVNLGIGIETIKSIWINGIEFHPHTQYQVGAEWDSKYRHPLAPNLYSIILRFVSNVDERLTIQQASTGYADVRNGLLRVAKEVLLSKSKDLIDWGILGEESPDRLEIQELRKLLTELSDAVAAREFEGSRYRKGQVSHESLVPFFARLTKIRRKVREYFNGFETGTFSAEDYAKLFRSQCFDEVGIFTNEVFNEIKKRAQRTNNRYFWLGNDDA